MKFIVTYFDLSCIKKAMLIYIIAFFIAEAA